jgi:hypothetical protein
MKTIAMIALAAATTIAPVAHAGEAKWTTVATSEDGAIYRVNVNSIERQFDKSGFPTQAYILIYRDTGGPQTPEGFHIVGFDCRGKWRVFDDVKTVHKTDPNSVVSSIEDIACWGKTQ